MPLSHWFHRQETSSPRGEIERGHPMKWRSRTGWASVAMPLLVTLSVSPALAARAPKPPTWTLSTYQSAQAFRNTAVPGVGNPLSYTFEFKQTSAYKTGNAYLTGNSPPPSPTGLKADIRIATVTGTPDFLGTGPFVGCESPTRGTVGLMFQKTKYRSGLDRWFYSPRTLLSSPLDLTTLTAPFDELGNWSSSNGKNAADPESRPPSMRRRPASASGASPSGRASTTMGSAHRMELRTSR